MNTKLLVWAGVATMLAACSHDEDQPLSKPDTPITVSVGVDNPESRAGYDNGNLPSAFVLFVKQNKGLDYGTDPVVNCNYNYGNVYMAFENNKWIPKNTGDVPLLWKSSNPDAEVTAYTLQSETIPGFTAASPASDFRVEVLSDQTTDINVKKSDWLYASLATAKPDNSGTLSIQLEHRLSKLKVTLSKGTEVTGDVTFQSVTVDGCCRLWTTADLSNDAVLDENTGEPQTGSISMMQSIASDNTGWECIVIPQKISTLAIRIQASNGKTYVYTSDKEVEFATKKSNTLTLKVGNDNVTLGGITPEEWNEGTSGNVETE